MRAHPALLVACLLLPAPVPSAAADLAVDAETSRVGFTLRTRWAQTLEGRFPDYEGGVLAMPDGTRQVRLTLRADEVEILDQPRYTRLTRGEGFFNAQRYPQVEFVSEHFVPELLESGGELAGVLSIRGVRRYERFDVAPADCERPLLDCAVVVAGDVSRSDYAMDRWAVALSDRVHFRLELRGREDRR